MMPSCFSVKVSVWGLSEASLYVPFSLPAPPLHLITEWERVLDVFQVFQDPKYFC